MSSGEDLETRFQNPLSFIDEISEEWSQEDSELEELYESTLESLPLIDNFYSDRNKCFSGGMKCIEQAWDKSASRKVALAWPKNEEASLKDKIIFLNEARISAALEHPNIIPVYQVGRNEEKMPLFAMKWLDGKSLEGCLKEKCCKSLDELLSSIIKVCEAIEYAHANGVIHLDLKPGNVQLDDFGEVLVLDWGLARLQNTEHFTAEESKIHESIEAFLKSRLRGTMDYISPELKLGEAPSPSMDIFALGVLIKDILNYCKPDVSSSNLASIESIYKKASSEEEKQRYKTVSELRNELQAFLHGYAVVAENPSLLKHLRLFINRNKAVCLTVFLALVMLTFLSVLFIVNLRESETTAVNALIKLEKENVLKDSLLDQLSVHVAEEQRLQQQSLNFDEAISKLEYLTALDSKNGNTWFQLARLKMGSLDFELARECLEKAEELGNSHKPVLKDLKKILAKYSSVKMWTNELYLEFYSEFRYEYIQATLCTVIYPRMKREEQIEFFEKAINARNPKLLHMNLKYEKKALVLDFSLSPKELNFSAAAGLPVRKLVLSNSTGNSLKFFQASSLKILEISNSDIDELLQLKSLETLIARDMRTQELVGDRHIWGNLVSLDLSGSQFKSWRFLAHCKTLETLNLSRTNVDFSGLKNLPKLQALIIDEDMTIPTKLANALKKRSVVIERLKD